MSFKFEPIEPKKEAVWVACPDFKPFTFREKLKITLTFRGFMGIFVLFFVVGYSNPFPNCKYAGVCKNFVHKNTLDNLNCVAGEYDTPRT